MRAKTNRFFILFFLLLSWGCREPFTPPQVAVSDHYLVVDGFINAGNGPTVFTLSRTRSIRDTGYSGITPPIYEENARVTIEDDQGNSFDLPEEEDGRYGNVQIPVNDQRKYRIHIVTAGHKEYVSSFVNISPQPVIDSIYWESERDGVHIYFDSYNTENITRYYRWTYSETWEIHTTRISRFKFISGKDTVVSRTPEEDVHICWNTKRSTNILIGNTAKLSNNSLSRAALAFIPVHSEKLSVLYSIKAEVSSLDKDEFEFWQRMKQNTEEMGTIFAPQPSTVRGNIKCVSDPEEPVIGYVGARAQAEKRIFISNRQLPFGWNQIQQCKLDTVVNNKDSLRMYLGGGYYIPVNAVLGRGSGIKAFEYTTRYCADCTVRGTTTKPPFWP